MKIPKTCAECNFNNLVSSGIVACKFRPNYHYDIPEEGKPVWCQLDNPTMQSLIKDAERWRKVVEIAKCEDSDDCPNECPVYDTCTNAICVEAYYIVKHIIDGEENREYDIESEEGIVGREGCETDTKEGGGRMKVIIAGSRGLKPYQLVTAAVQQSCLNITEVVSGGAKGIDTYGEMWAVKNHVNIALFPADWDKHGRKAGPMRNRKMAEYADALIAIWDGKSRGTKNMIDTMESMGKPTYVYTVN